MEPRLKLLIQDWRYRAARDTVRVNTVAVIKQNFQLFIVTYLFIVT